MPNAVSICTSLGAYTNPNDIIPVVYELLPNYPNPFNRMTQISFHLASYEFVELAVYDLNGRCVNSLICDDQKKGDHTITWNGADAHGQGVSSGIYFYRIISDDLVRSRKMLLVK